MGRLRGISIILYTKNKVGEDEFGAPVYEELPEVVNDVLVGEPEGSDVTDTLNLTGKRLAYTLAIPKGDTHEWRDRKVEFFGRKFRTFGEPVEGIEGMIPLRWNKKVKVERYE
jgi:hypothetical protein